LLGPFELADLSQQGLSTMSETHVCVFDPRLGGEQDADKKILYYHPSRTPLGEQVSAVNLCEAVAIFSGTFSTAGCEILHTKNGRLISMKIEENMWLMVSMPHAPSSGAAGKSAAAATGAQPPGPSGRDEGESPEELPASEETLQDCSLKALAERIYSTLRLSCGSLTKVSAERGVDALRLLLSEVVPVLLRVVIPPGDDDARKLDLLDALEAMRFLPVDPRVYLRVQYCLNQILLGHPCVRHSMMLHGDSLVWSSLTRGATQLVHRAVVSLTAPALQPTPKHGEPPPFSPVAAATAPDEALLFATALLQRQQR
jgi:hypothetical protein